MSDDPSQPEEMKLLPAAGEARRPAPPNPAAPPERAETAAMTPAAAVSGVSSPRQLADLPAEDLGALAEELGLEPGKYKSPPELVRAIHGRRQLIAALDRDALLDVVRWGRRPAPVNATREQLAHEALRIKTMRFEGLSERGLLALARLRGVELEPGMAVPNIVKRLKKREGFFARMNRKRRAVLGSIVSGIIGENGGSAAYQVPPPSNEAAGLPSPVGAGAAAGRDRSIKEEIEESGLFGGIASRVKKTADQYINQKLDEIESRIDRKLDEIDRRLAEWRDKEIANRLRILKITLWASVIVAALSLIYSYLKVNFPVLFGASDQPTANKVEGTTRPGK